MTTHDGEVTAAHEWDEPAALRSVRPSLPGSYERLFHDVGLPAVRPAALDAGGGSVPLPARVSSAPSACFIARKRSARATTSRRGCPSSSISSCMSTARAHWSHSSGGAATKSICQRPTRQECDMRMRTTAQTSAVQIRAGTSTHRGDLSIPERALGLVVFAHGSGSSRFSGRNRAVAQVLENGGCATLLLDLLTREEEAIDDPHARYPLRRRLASAIALSPPSIGPPGKSDGVAAAACLFRRQHGSGGSADRRRRASRDRARGHLARRSSRSRGIRVADGPGARPCSSSAATTSRSSS